MPANGLALDLRMTLRSVRTAAPLFLVAVLTVALGVGVNAAMFSVVNAVVLRPLPYRAPAELVALWPEKRWSLQMLRDVEQRVSSYRSVAAYRAASYTLLGEGLPEPVPVAAVSPTYFSVLGVSPARGRALAAGDATGQSGPVVVLSHGLWQRRFGGDPSVVGRTIRLAGGGIESRTVVGVLAPGITPIPATAEAWVPIVTTPDRPGYFGGYGMSVVGRLRPERSAEQARAELRRLVPELTPTHPSQFRPARYSPVDVVPLLESMTRTVRTPLLVLLGAVACVLLIACTNVANLLLARAYGRQRAVAIQLSLGCSRRRLVRQVLTESVLLAIAGGVVGLLAAGLALPLIRGVVADDLPRATGIAIDARVLAFAALASLLTGLVFGSVPAAHAARATPGATMRATAGRGQSQGRASGRVNDLFVVAEIALSLMLLAGAGLLLKSLWQLTRVDPGFSAARVLTLEVTVPPGRYDSLPARAALLRQLEERVGALPGVTTVGAIDFLPLTGRTSGIPYRVDGQDAAQGGSQVVSLRIVTPAYFDALRIPLLRGRPLGPADVPVDSAGESAALVNAAFARQHWGGESPLGKRILSTTGNPLARIVGVVADARQTAMDAAAAPEMYLAASQVGWQGGYLLVRGVRRTPPQSDVVAGLRAVEPELGVREVRTMDEVVRAAMDDDRLYAGLLSTFAALALVLGLVGVYGVMTYAASRRTREFGVRLALGATRRALLLHVLGRAMVPVAVGVALGVGGALALTRLLTRLLFGVAPGDPGVLGGVALLLVAAAAGAALVPAVRASRVSPVHALRAE